MSKHFKLIAGNALILLILLVIVELILRAADVGSYGTAPMNPDSVYHHVHPRDYRFVNYSLNNDYGAVTVTYDDQGRRSPDRGWPANLEEKPSIAFLGDSFVESNQVSYDSSFIGRLQALCPAYAIYNYGVSSYSPAIHYLIVKHRLLQEKPMPTKVVMMVYSNDVRDDETYLASAVYDSSGEITALDGGESPSALMSFLRSANLFRMLRKTHLTIAFMLKNKVKEKQEQKVVGDQLEENPDWEGTQSAAYVLKTARLLAQHNIDFQLTVVPSKYNDFSADYSTPEFSQKVAVWAAASGISFIDLTKPFKAWREKHDEKLFYNVDIHFNDSGHGVVARVLAPHINSNEIISCNLLTFN
jgi:hypothetical protein